MKDMETQLRAYRCLYWANQGLLQAFRALKELDEERASIEKKKFCAGPRT
jgi:hypothetical protein